MSINTLSNISDINYNSTYDDNDQQIIPKNVLPSYYTYNVCIYDIFIILCKCTLILGCFTGIIIIIIICI